MSLTGTTSVAIIDSKNCAQLANTEKPFILVLKLGENLFEGIMRCAEQINLKSAYITGLGALDDVTVAYYHLDRKEYQTQLFKGMFELISLNGNISFTGEGKRFIHIHAALGKDDFSVIGGHIMDGTVGPTVEICVIPMAAKIQREYNERIGLKLMCPMQG